MTGAATLGVFGYLTSGDIVKGGGNLISVVVGAIVMVALGFAIDKYERLKVLKEYSLGIAMLFGVIIAMIYNL